MISIIGVRKMPRVAQLGDARGIGFQWLKWQGKASARGTRAGSPDCQLLDKGYGKAKCGPKGNGIDFAIADRRNQVWKGERKKI